MLNIFIKSAIDFVELAFRCFNIFWYAILNTLKIRVVYWDITSIIQAEYNFFKSPDRLSGRSDVTADKLKLKKKSGHQEFVWHIKQFGVTVT